MVLVAATVELAAREVQVKVPEMVARQETVEMVEMGLPPAPAPEVPAELVDKVVVVRELVLRPVVAVAERVALVARTEGMEAVAGPVEQVVQITEDQEVPELRVVLVVPVVVPRQDSLAMEAMEVPVERVETVQPVPEAPEAMVVMEETDQVLAIPVVPEGRVGPGAHHRALPEAAARMERRRGGRLFIV